MGFASYFEDIEKARENAEALRQNIREKRKSASLPNKNRRIKYSLQNSDAIDYYEAMLSAIEDRARILIADLDRILDMSTNYQIERENIIFQKELDISKLKQDLQTEKSKYNSLSNENIRVCLVLSKMKSDAMEKDITLEKMRIEIQRNLMHIKELEASMTAKAEKIARLEEAISELTCVDSGRRLFLEDATKHGTRVWKR